MTTKKTYDKQIMIAWALWQYLQNKQNNIAKFGLPKLNTVKPVLDNHSSGQSKVVRIERVVTSWHRNLSGQGVVVKE